MNQAVAQGRLAPDQKTTRTTGDAPLRGAIETHRSPVFGCRSVVLGPWTLTTTLNNIVDELEGGMLPVEGEASVTVLVHGQDAEAARRVLTSNDPM